MTIITSLLALTALAAMLWAVVLARRLITAEKRIAVPLRDEISRQEGKLREAEDLSRSRDLFLAALSHELRTPLSGIVGAAGLLEQTGLNSRQQEYTRLISHAGTTVLDIVDDMLTFARVQAGKAETTYTTFSVQQLVDGMLALQSINARQRGLALVRDVSSDVPMVVTGERGKLNQVLLNTIGNAIKFTDEGAITVRVERLNDEDDKVWLEFTIADTGVGIEQHDSDKLFTPFFQGQTAEAGRGGTGLGLAICRRLVRTMGGEISIKGNPNEGTSVIFTMPFYLPDRVALATFHKERNHQADAEPLWPDAVQVLTSTAGQLILVVEDDEINRLVCMRILALLGYHPVVAADAAQALQILYEGRHQPHAMLMDINLAGESGADLAMRLKTEDGGRWRDVPVIAMSADVSGAAQQAARQAGMLSFIKKPFSSDQLRQVLEAVLDPAASSAPLPNDTMPYLSRAAADATLNALADLDHAWLEQEIQDLGVSTVLEMVNIFRASAATTLRTLSQALKHQDAEKAVRLTHKLTGSALNLGMRGVAAQARNMEYSLMHPETNPTANHEHALERLEACCHASADLVRAYLVEYAKQSVTLTTSGDQ